MKTAAEAMATLFAPDVFVPPPRKNMTPGIHPGGTSRFESDSSEGRPASMGERKKGLFKTNNFSGVPRNKTTCGWSEKGLISEVEATSRSSQVGGTAAGTR